MKTEYENIFQPRCRYKNYVIQLCIYIFRLFRFGSTFISGETFSATKSPTEFIKTTLHEEL